MSIDDGTTENEIDHDTEKWPVPVDLRSDLDKIKWAYRATPLRVFAKDAFVEVLNVNNMISGALVEMHFELYHYCIRATEQDSFNARIQQILVLQPGKPRPITTYKRKNVRDGPIHLNQAMSKRRCIESNARAGCSNSATEKSEKDVGIPTESGNTLAFAGGSGKKTESDPMSASGSTPREENCSSLFHPFFFPLTRPAAFGNIPTLTLIDLRQTETANGSATSDEGNEEGNRSFSFFIQR